MVHGDVVTTFKDGLDLYDVRLRLDEPLTAATRRSLGQLTVPSAKLGRVRLDSVVDAVRGTGPAQIDRRNRERQISSAGQHGARATPSATRSREIDRRVAQLDIPPGYRTGVTRHGQADPRDACPASSSRSCSRSSSCTWCSASQFESFLHPITILLSLPLAVPFALVSLWLVGATLNMFSALGILLLFGVVKKNAILQIDHTIGLRAEGVPMAEAIIQANRERLRPILMTTISLVAGMIPLVFSTATAPRPTAPSASSSWAARRSAC